MCSRGRGSGGHETANLWRADTQTRIKSLGDWNFKDWFMRYEGSEKQKILSHPLVLPKSEGVLGIFYIILIPCFSFLVWYLHLIWVLPLWSTDKFW